MRKFLLSILLIATTQILFSQISKKEQNEELIRNAKEIRMNDSRDAAYYVSTPLFIVFKDGYTISHEKALEYSKSFCVSDNVDFQLKNSHTTKDGKTLYRYEQTIDGYPVEFSAWHIHVKNGRVTTLNGDIVDVKDFKPVFSISETEALQAALNFIGAETYMWQDEDEEQTLKEFFNDENSTYYPTGTKVVVPFTFASLANPLRPCGENKDVNLTAKNAKFTQSPQGTLNSETLNFKPETLNSAYKFNIFSKLPYDRKMVYVDAQTGEILLDLPLIHFSDEIGTAHTQYSGIQQINTVFNDTEYILRDNTRGNGIRTLNCNNGTSYNTATEFFDDDNEWNNVNAQLDQYATDAHFATMSTYDYFYNVHNRNSINGNGFALRSYVHYSLIKAGYPNNVNAFWNGQWMTYGDGAVNQGITPLTTIDICGHEITHGLTQYTANLVYAYESGALNESFSDIFGTAIEFYAVPEYANWTIGEKMGATFRSMQNPKAYQNPNTYKGQYWITSSYDNGGVHINSGVLNYWFYLLSEGGSGINDNGHIYEVEPIGIENAEQIAFKLLTEYLTPSSQYIDAYLLGIQAANELFGYCSPETKSVGDAFYAVGVITQPYVNSLIIDFKASISEFCAAPAETKFVNKSINGINYLWNFGDGNTSTDFSPVHTYTESGNYTVSLSVEGGVCGSDTETKEDYIKIDESFLCSIIMPINSHIQFEGCEGIIYDCGGPGQNYADNANSRLTIYAPLAESIILEIEEFDIEPGSGNTCDYDYVEFRDGNSVNSPLINNRRYCNTTGNPGTISSTGEYITIRFVSDQLLTFSGYKISFHCIEGKIPEPEFSTNTETSCNGFISFTDESANYPKAWQWDFGDGNTSTLKNPTNQYAENGIYTVTLTVSNQCGENTITKEAFLTVEMPEPPEIGDIDACNNMNFNIEIDIAGTAYWYENISSNKTVHIGNIWEQHPSITEEKTYFVREVFETDDKNVGDNCASYFTEVRLIPNPCTSISQNQFDDIVIYPNPTTGELRVESGELRIKDIEIFDVIGRIQSSKFKVQSSETETMKVQSSKFKVQSSEPETRNFEPETIIDISNLSNGIYFIKITTNKEIITKKIVKY